MSAGGVIAGCLVGATLDARQRAAEAASDPPVSYLIGLRRELDAHHYLDLVRRHWHRTENS